MKVTVSLPVPPYLRKFLEAKFGQTYQANQSDWFGLLVLNTLSRKTDRDYNDRSPATKDYFTITLGITKANEFGFLLNRRKGDQLAKAIDNYFRRQLYEFAIINQRNLGIDYKISILNFLEEYGITEEDLPYETIRRDFNRTRRKIEENLDNNFK